MEDYEPSASKVDAGKQINSGRWTRDEHDLFLKGLAEFGKDWKRIAGIIETRTVVQIRTHAQKYFQKLAKSTGGPVMSTSKKGDVVRPVQRKRKGVSADPSYSDEEDEEEIPRPRKKRSSAGSSGGYRKPKNIRVPSFPKPNGHSSSGFIASGSSATSAGSGKIGKVEEGGGVTPRTVAAATILLRPRIQHKIQTGGDTPKTREQATWLASQQERAAQVLGKPRRSAVSKLEEVLNTPDDMAQPFQPPLSSSSSSSMPNPATSREEGNGKDSSASAQLEDSQPESAKAENTGSVVGAADARKDSKDTSAEDTTAPLDAETAPAVPKLSWDGAGI